MVAPGGRLIVCHYRTPGEAPADWVGLIASLGRAPADRSSVERVDVVWSDL
jgi:hypothetical protein